MLSILKTFSLENALQHHEFRTNDEKYIGQWLSLKSYLAVNDEEQMNRVVGHLSDIAAHRQEILDLEQELQHSEDLIHLLAHDLKNPLASIAGLAT